MTENLFQTDFPIFENRFKQDEVVYLDNASTTLKPKRVINAVNNFYNKMTSNVFRGNHRIAEDVTIAINDARSSIASFIHAKSNEIVFTYSCTDAINMVAVGLNLSSNSEIITSTLEHHSNLLPWLQRFKTNIIGLNNNGEIDLNQLSDSITPKTALIAVSYCSNVTGNIQPISEIVRIARERGILTLIDASQAISHLSIDTKALDCDYLVFSGHKMFGPSGIGVLYGKEEKLQRLQPFRLGGGMVNKVSIDRNLINFKQVPNNLEGGTPNIEGILGLGEAVNYYFDKGHANIEKQNHTIERIARNRLEKCNQIELPFKHSPSHIPIFTFRPRGKKVDVYNLGRILSDRYNIAVCSGYQCAQPLYEAADIKGGVRASFHIYNSERDIDKLITALDELKPILE